MWRRVLLSLAAVLVLGVCPAEASTLSFGSGAYTYTGTAADSTVTITQGAGGFVFTDTATITVLASADARCSDSATEVTCQTTGVTTIAAILLGGVDNLVMRNSTVALEADGGDGTDTITGSLGDDTIFGGDGSDTLSGLDGVDVMSGEPGTDNLTGADGDDFLFGGEGNDTLTGGDGEDAIDGNADDDVVIAGPENDDINGGAGTGDRIRYDEANRGLPVTVNLATDAGTDGGPGETGEDALFFEHVTGTRFADQINGDNQGNDLVGGVADDRLSGGAGADALHGSGGDDHLDGGPQADLIDGGAGKDLADYQMRGMNLTVTVGDGVANDGSAGEQDQVLATEVLLGGSANDAFTMVENTPAEFWGNGGNDTLAGGALDDVLIGGPGGDRSTALAEPTGPTTTRAHGTRACT